MKDNEKNLRQQSNIRIYIIFAVIILASLLGGFFMGKLVGANKGTLNEIDWDRIRRLVADTLPIVYGLLTLAAFVVIFVMYGRLRHAIVSWDGENEDEIADIERRITNVSALPCVVVLVGLVLFPVCIYAVDRSYSNSKGMPMTIVSEVVFVVSMILYCVIELSLIHI